MRGPRAGVRRTPALIALALTIALVVSVGTARASQQEQSLDETLARGFHLVETHQIDSAAALFADAQKRAVAAHDTHGEAEARRGLGDVLIARGHFDDALVELSAALGLAESTGDRLQMGRVLASRGLAFFSKADSPHLEEAYDAAIDAFAGAGAFREQAAAMRMLNRSSRFTWEERERRIERAMEVLAKEPDATTEGLLLHQWGDILSNEGRYALSLEKLQQALPRLQASSDRAPLARLLTSLGRSYRLHGLYDEAIAQYRRAIQIQTAVGDIAGVAQSENAIAIALYHSGNLRAELPHSRRALALAERSGQPEQVAFLRMSLASTYLDLGDPRRALPLLAPDPALEKTDDSSRWAHLSDAHRRLGQTEVALADARQAVAIARETKDPERIAYALSMSAESHVALGELEAAYGDESEALKTLEDVRTNLAPGDEFRQNFSDTVSEFFTSAIRVLTRLGRHAEALDVAEEARGRAFLDLIASRDVAPDAATGARDSERKRLVAEPPLSHEAMRAALAGMDSTLLAYWVAEEGAYAWVLGADGVVHGRRLAITANRLRSLVDAMSASGTRASVDTTADPSRVLYAQLITPIEAWLPAQSGSLVTIVPHGPLFRLAFAALADARGHYFVERHAVHYVTSLSVLGRTRARPPDAESRGALLVADPTLDPQLATREHLAPLTGARAEVAAIARGFAPQAVSVLTGDHATEAAVKRNAPSARVLHFATHALISDAAPLDSFLALSRGDGGDGRLTSADIYEMKLNAELVVLSACSTARGRITGDGVIGLSRAFVYAGAPSLIATLWNVGDDPATYLMRSFYATWRKGGTKAAGLRAAQLDLIHALRAGSITASTPFGTVTLSENPAFWASFVLFGEP